jgi:hypothetical protein
VGDLLTNEHVFALERMVRAMRGYDDREVTWSGLRRELSAAGAALDGMPPARTSAESRFQDELSRVIDAVHLHMDGALGADQFRDAIERGSASAREFRAQIGGAAAADDR